MGRYNVRVCCFSVLPSTPDLLTSFFLSSHLSCVQEFPEEADLHGYVAPLAFITIPVSGYHYYSLADT